MSPAVCSEGRRQHQVAWPDLESDCGQPRQAACVPLALYTKRIIKSVLTTSYLRLVYSLWRHSLYWPMDARGAFAFVPWAAAPYACPKFDPDQTDEGRFHRPLCDPPNQARIPFEMAQNGRAMEVQIQNVVCVCLCSSLIGLTHLATSSG